MPIDRDDADERRERIDRLIEEARTKTEATVTRADNAARAAKTALRTAKAQLPHKTRKKPAV